MSKDAFAEDIARSLFADHEPAPARKPSLASTPDQQPQSQGSIDSAINEAMAPTPQQYGPTRARAAEQSKSTIDTAIDEAMNPSVNTDPSEAFRNRAPELLYDDRTATKVAGDWGYPNIQERDRSYMTPDIQAVQANLGPENTPEARRAVQKGKATGDVFERQPDVLTKTSMNDTLRGMFRTAKRTVTRIPAKFINATFPGSADPPTTPFSNRYQAASARSLGGVKSRLELASELSWERPEEWKALLQKTYQRNAAWQKIAPTYGNWLERYGQTQAGVAAPMAVSFGYDAFSAGFPVLSFAMWAEEGRGSMLASGLRVIDVDKLNDQQRRQIDEAATVAGNIYSLIEQWERVAGKGSISDLLMGAEKGSALWKHFKEAHKESGEEFWQELLENAYVNYVRAIANPSMPEDERQKYISVGDMLLNSTLAYAQSIPIMLGLAIPGSVVRNVSESREKAKGELLTLLNKMLAIREQQIDKAAQGAKPEDFEGMGIPPERIQSLLSRNDPAGLSRAIIDAQIDEAKRRQGERRAERRDARIAAAQEGAGFGQDPFQQDAVARAAAEQEAAPVQGAPEELAPEPQPAPMGRQPAGVDQEFIPEGGGGQSVMSPLEVQGRIGRHPIALDSLSPEAEAAHKSIIDQVATTGRLPTAARREVQDDGKENAPEGETKTPTGTGAVAGSKATGIGGTDRNAVRPDGVTAVPRGTPADRAADGGTASSIPASGVQAGAASQAGSGRSRGSIRTAQTAPDGQQRDNRAQQRVGGRTFDQALEEIGLTREEYSARSRDESDLTDMPAEYEGRIDVRTSAIEGQGAFVTEAIQEGRTVAPAAVEGNRTPLGRYLNHSEQPNSKTVRKGNRLNIVAMRDLAPGEEVTIDYSQYRRMMEAEQESAAAATPTETKATQGAAGTTAERPATKSGQTPRNQRAAPPSSTPVATFAHMQPNVEGQPPIPMFKLERDIPGHDAGSTVSDDTLREAGIEVPEIPAEKPSRTQQGTVKPSRTPKRSRLPRSRKTEKRPRIDEVEKGDTSTQPPPSESTPRAAQPRQPRRQRGQAKAKKGTQQELTMLQDEFRKALGGEEPKARPRMLPRRAGSQDARFRELTKTWTPGGSDAKSVEWKITRKAVKESWGSRGKMSTIPARHGAFVDGVQIAQITTPARSFMDSRGWTVEVLAPDGRPIVSFGTKKTLAEAKELLQRRLLDALQRIRSEAPITEGSVTGRGLAPTTADIPSAWTAWRESHPAEYAELEKMRADVLKAQGYNVGPVFHGTDAEFTTFDMSLADANEGGTFFADQRSVAEDFGERVVPAYLRMRNPDTIDYLGWAMSQEPATASRDLGYDGVIIENYDPQEIGNAKTAYMVFSPSQIKSAEVAPDDTGRIPPPSEWGQAENPDIRYLPKPRRVTPEQDRQYLAAVEAEDIETAQRMVDEAAKAAGYTSPQLFRGSVEDEGNVLSDSFEAGEGIFLTDNDDVAQIFTAERSFGEVITDDWDEEAGEYVDREPGPVINAYVRFKNPLVLTDETTPTAQEVTDDTSSQTKAIRKAKADGYDGIVLQDVREGVGDWTEYGSTYVAFESSQVKLSNTITRDDKGRVIPLSKRFDAQQDDIRFMPKPKRTPAAMARILDAGIKLAEHYIGNGTMTFKTFANQIKTEMPDAWNQAQPILHGVWSTAAATHPEIEDVSRAQAASIIEQLNAAPAKPKTVAKPKKSQRKSKTIRVSDHVSNAGTTYKVVARWGQAVDVVPLDAPDDAEPETFHVNNLERVEKPKGTAEFIESTAPKAPETTIDDLKARFKPGKQVWILPTNLSKKWRSAIVHQVTSTSDIRVVYRDQYLVVPLTHVQQSKTTEKALQRQEQMKGMSQPDRAKVTQDSAEFDKLMQTHPDFWDPLEPFEGSEKDVSIQRHKAMQAGRRAAFIAIGMETGDFENPVERAAALPALREWMNANPAEDALAVMIAEQARDGEFGGSMLRPGDIALVGSTWYEAKDAKPGVILDDGQGNTIDVDPFEDYRGQIFSPDEPGFNAALQKMEAQNAPIEAPAARSPVVSQPGQTIAETPMPTLGRRTRLPQRVPTIESTKKPKQRMTPARARDKLIKRGISHLTGRGRGTAKKSKMVKPWFPKGIDVEDKQRFITTQKTDLKHRTLAKERGKTIEYLEMLVSFQGAKKAVAEYMSPYWSRIWTPEVRKSVTVLHDFFGGGGNWGAHIGLRAFPNLQRLHVHEYTGTRIDKIVLHQNMGDQFRELMKSTGVEAEVRKMYDDMLESGRKSGGTLSKIIDSAIQGADAITGDNSAESSEQAVQRLTGDPKVMRLAILRGLADGLGRGEITNLTEALNKIADEYRESKRRIDEMKARGVSITYHHGDSYAFQIEPGPHVMSVIDVPYYNTTGYGSQRVGLDFYRRTADLAERLISARNHMVYTDELWSMDNKEVPQEELPEAISLMNRIAAVTPHFDAWPDMVASRFEVIGLNNSMEQEQAAEVSRPRMLPRRRPSPESQMEFPRPPRRDNRAAVTRGKGLVMGAISYKRTPLGPDRDNPRDVIMTWAPKTWDDYEKGRVGHLGTLWNEEEHVRSDNFDAWVYDPKNNAIWTWGVTPPMAVAIIKSQLYQRYGIKGVTHKTITDAFVEKQMSGGVEPGGPLPLPPALLPKATQKRPTRMLSAAAAPTWFTKPGMMHEAPDEDLLRDRVRTHDLALPYMVLDYWQTIGFAEIANNDNPEITRAFLDAVSRIPRMTPGTRRSPIYRFQGYQTQEALKSYLSGYRPGAIIGVSRPVNTFSDSKAYGIDLATSYGGEHIVEFRIEKPSRGRSLSALRNMSETAEVLYGEGDQFRVVSVKPDINDGHTVVTLQEVAGRQGNRALKFLPKATRRPLAPTFYSNILKALETWQNKGTPDQLRAHLFKVKGAKAEAQWMALDAFLEGKTSVTKEEAQAFARENQVETRLIAAGGQSSIPKDAVWETDNLIDASHTAELRLGTTLYGYIMRDPSTRKYFAYNQRDNQLTQGYDSRIEAIEAAGMIGEESATKFAQYSTPGGRNYVEGKIQYKRPGVLSIVPEYKAWARANPSKPIREYRDILAEKTGLRMEEMRVGGYTAVDTATNVGTVLADARSWEEALTATYALAAKRYGVPKAPFTGGHWDEPDIQTHFRGAMHATTDGKVFMLDEAQSDPANKAHQIRSAEVQRVAKAKGITLKEAGKLVPQDFATKRFPTGVSPEHAAATEQLRKSREILINMQIAYPVDLDDTTKYRDLVEKQQIDDASDTTEEKWAAVLMHSQALMAMDAVMRAERADQGKMVSMPFTNDWLPITLKQALRYAVEQGADHMAWTTAKQQVDRWESAMRKSVDHIVWERGPEAITKESLQQSGYHAYRTGGGADDGYVIRGPDGKTASPSMDPFPTADRAWAVLMGLRRQTGAGKVRIRATKNKSTVFDEWVRPEGETEIHGKQVTLDALIGKTMATQIRESTENTGHFEGSDLVIGGEQFRIIYDQEIPKFLEKYGKQWGVKPTTIRLGPQSAEAGMPNFDPIPDHIWEGYAGAEEFSTGDKPLISHTKLAVNGVDTQVDLILDRNGITIISADENEIEPSEWHMAAGAELTEPSEATLWLSRQWESEDIWKKAETTLGAPYRTIGPPTGRTSETRAQVINDLNAVIEGTDDQEIAEAASRILGDIEQENATIQDAFLHEMQYGDPEMARAVAEQIGYAPEASGAGRLDPEQLDKSVPRDPRPGKRDVIFDHFERDDTGRHIIGVHTDGTRVRTSGTTDIRLAQSLTEEYNKLLEQWRASGSGITVPAIPITPEMRESVLYAGQPRFMPAQTPQNGLDSTQNRSMISKGEQDDTEVTHTASPQNRLLANQGRQVNDVQAGRERPDTGRGNTDAPYRRGETVRRRQAFARHKTSITDLCPDCRYDPAFEQNIDFIAAADRFAKRDITLVPVSGFTRAYGFALDANTVLIDSEAPFYEHGGVGATAEHEANHIDVMRGNPDAIALQSLMNPASPSAQTWRDLVAFAWIGTAWEGRPISDQFIQEELAGDVRSGALRMEDAVYPDKIEEGYRILSTLNTPGESPTRTNQPTGPPRMLPPTRGGFYSALTRAVESLPDNTKMPGDQWLKRIQGMANKGISIKAQEIEESGFGDYLTMMQEQGQSVTKADALAFLAQNGVRLEEVRKGGEEFDSELEGIQRNEDGSFRAYVTGPRGFTDRDFASRESAVEWINEMRDQGYSPTKFSEYAPPGGVPGTYREVLLTVPLSDIPLSVEKVTIGGPEIWDIKYTDRNRAGQNLNGGVYEREIRGSDQSEWEGVFLNERSTFQDRDEAVEWVKNQMRATSPKLERPAGAYSSPHWSEPNVIAHMLMDERRIPLDVLAETQPELAAKLKDEGKTEARALHMIEGQSDFAQSIQGKDVPRGSYDKAAAERDRQRFYSGKGEMSDGEWGALVERVRQYDAADKALPNLPFKGEAWKRLVIRKMLAEAVAQDMDLLTWSTGEDRFKKWGSQRVDWKRGSVAGSVVVTDRQSGEVRFRSPDDATPDQVSRLRKDYPSSRFSVTVEKGSGWTVSAQEQHGGTHDGMDIEEMARERGQLLETKGQTVRTKDDLRKVIERIKRGDETNVDKLTDRIWDRMQNEDEGTSLPRKEFFEFLYDTSFRNEAAKIVRKMDKGIAVKTAKLTGVNPGMSKRFMHVASDGTRYWVEDTRDGTRITPYFDAAIKAMEETDSIERGDVPANAIELTPAIRASVAQGQPLFLPKPNKERRLQNVIREEIERRQAAGEFVPENWLIAAGMEPPLRGMPPAYVRNLEKAVAETIKTMHGQFAEQREQDIGDAYQEWERLQPDIVPAPDKQKKTVPGMAAQIARTAFKSGNFRGKEYAYADRTPLDDLIDTTFEKLKKNFKGHKDIWLRTLEKIADDVDQAHPRVRSLLASGNTDQADEVIKNTLVGIVGSGRYRPLRIATRNDREHTWDHVLFRLDSTMAAEYGRRILRIAYDTDPKLMWTDPVNGRSYGEEFEDALQTAGTPIDRLTALKEQSSRLAWMRKNRVERGITQEQIDAQRDKVNALRQDAQVAFAKLDRRRLADLYEKLTTLRAESTWYQDQARAAPARRRYQMIKDAEVESRMVPVLEDGKTTRPWIKRLLIDGQASLRELMQLSSGGNREGTLSKLGRQYTESEDAKGSEMARAMDAMSDEMHRLKISMRDARRWGRRTHTFRSQGRKVKLSEAQIMSMYATMQDVDADRFIKNGAKPFQHRGKVDKHDIREADAEQTETLMRSITDTLSPRQKAIVDWAINYNAGLAPVADTVSLAVYGRRKFVSPKHWRMYADRSDTRYDALEIENMGQMKDVWLDKTGMTKDRVKHGHPFLLKNFFTSWMEQTEELAAFIHQTVPQMELITVVRGQPFRGAMLERFGSTWERQVQEIAKRMAGLATIERGRSWLERWWSKRNSDIAVAMLWNRRSSRLKNRIPGSTLLFGQIMKHDPRVAVSFVLRGLKLRPRVPFTTIFLSPRQNAFRKRLMQDGFFNYRWGAGMMHTFTNVAKIEIPEAEKTEWGHMRRSLAQAGMLGMAAEEIKNATQAMEAYLANGYSTEEAIEWVKQATRTSQNPSSAADETVAYTATRKNPLATSVIPFLGQPSVAANILRSDLMQLNYAIKSKEGLAKALSDVMTDLVVITMASAQSVYISRLFRTAALGSIRLASLFTWAGDDDEEKMRDKANAIRDFLVETLDNILPGSGRVASSATQVWATINRRGRVAVDTDNLVFSALEKAMNGILDLKKGIMEEDPDISLRAALNTIDGFGMGLGAPTGGPVQDIRVLLGLGGVRTQGSRRGARRSRQPAGRSTKMRKMKAVKARPAD